MIQVQKRRFIYLMLIFCMPFLLWIHKAYAESDEPLPAAQAFIFSSHLDAANQLTLTWRLSPNVYLYKDRLHLQSPEQAIALDAFLPPSQIKKDKVLGDHPIYTKALQVVVPLTQYTFSTNPVQLILKYQGCSSKGFCYPPIRKTLNLDLVNHRVLDTPMPFVSSVRDDESKATRLLQGHHPGTLILGFLGLGLLLAFTPCVLPMIPILSSIIVGYGETLTTRKAFFLALAYVLGMAVAYALAGMAVAAAGGSVQAALQRPWVILLFSGVFVLLAFSLFGGYDLRLPASWHNWLVKRSNQQKAGTYLGVFAMGAISSLIVSPCVSAPLVGVLAYIASTGNILLGGSALLALGLGMGIPLLIIGTSAGRFLPRAGAWMDVVKQLFGLMMLGMAIWMLARIFSTMVIALLWAGLAFIAGMLFWRYRSLHPTWHRLNRTVSVALLLYALILMVSSLLTQSTTSLQGASSAAVESATGFVTVRSMQALDAEFARAHKENKWLLLDFYADWCSACIEMQKNVFPEAIVKSALANTILVRVDITQHTDFDTAIQQRYHVVAPPTFLFFKPGKMDPFHHLVGEVSATEFVATLQHVRAI